MKLTKKEKAVVDYMLSSGKCCHTPTSLTDLVYSKEIQAQYNFSKGRKVVIDYMICCYIGKMAKKGILVAKMCPCRGVGRLGSYNLS